MKNYLTVLGLCVLLTSVGCAPVLIGAGAAGGYAVGTDARTVGDQWDDATITANIKTKMSDDPGVNAGDVDADTSEGHVILTGVVKTGKEAERAVEIARKVPGVKSVKNALQVGSRTMGQYLDDKMLVSKVKSKLFGEPYIRSLSIDVDANLGVVSLTGFVKSKAQKEKALELARSVPNVVKVIDNIRVKSP
jgi:hyperosmotically inducible protein